MLIVERLTEDFAICERPDRTMIEIPREALPDGVREGDCLLELADGGFRVDPDETARRRRHNADLFRRLLIVDDEEDDTPEE